MCAVWEGLRQLALWAGINLAEYRMVIYALVLILMMILRPQGLMGVGEVWDLRLRGRTRAAAARDVDARPGAAAGSGGAR
jgi:hypothetical protein